MVSQATEVTWETRVGKSYNQPLRLVSICDRYMGRGGVRGKRTGKGSLFHSPNGMGVSRKRLEILQLSSVRPGITHVATNVQGRKTENILCSNNKERTRKRKRIPRELQDTMKYPKMVKHQHRP